MTAHLEPARFSSGIPGADHAIIVGLELEKELIAAVQSAGAGGRVAVISDDVVGKKWGGGVVSSLAEAGIAAELFTFPHGEKNKHQATASSLQDELLKKRYGRDTLILALGGGVVGDVAGYVAATYLRGVPYIQIPTTLLAMVDSSIGGKVGVDTQYGKNSVGAFWQPSAVIADLKFLQGLPQKEIVSGLLEAIKSFFTSDKDALRAVDTLTLVDPLSSPEALREIVVRSIKFKAGVVARDEREENERMILNFGHTVGHAVELLSGYEMPHGFAVGYGMLVETKIAEDLGVLPSADRALVCSYLERFGITAAGLKDFKVDDVLEAMKGDKKARGGAIYCVLIRAIGAVSTEGGNYAHLVEEAVVRNAYQSITQS